MEEKKKKHDMLTLMIYCFAYACLSACREDFFSCCYRALLSKGEMVMFQQ